MNNCVLKWNINCLKSNPSAEPCEQAPCDGFKRRSPPASFRNTSWFQTQSLPAAVGPTPKPEPLRSPRFFSSLSTDVFILQEGSQTMGIVTPWAGSRQAKRGAEAVPRAAARWREGGWTALQSARFPLCSSPQKRQDKGPDGVNQGLSPRFVQSSSSAEMKGVPLTNNAQKQSSSQRAFSKLVGGRGGDKKQSSVFVGLTSSTGELKAGRIIRLALRKRCSCNTDWSKLCDRGLGPPHSAASRWFIFQECADSASKWKFPSPVGTLWGRDPSPVGVKAGCGATPPNPEQGRGSSPYVQYSKHSDLQKEAPN